MGKKEQLNSLAEEGRLSCFEARDPNILKELIRQTGGGIGRETLTVTCSQRIEFGRMHGALRCTVAPGQKKSSQIFRKRKPCIVFGLQSWTLPGQGEDPESAGKHTTQI